MTDRSIIQLLNQRDERGLEETQRLYGQRLTRIAETLLSKEDAEECVNDVYTALWNRVPQDESDSLMPYLAAILRNLARMRWRAEKAAKRSAEIISLSDETAEILPDPTDRIQPGGKCSSSATGTDGASGRSPHSSSARAPRRRRRSDG